MMIYVKIKDNLYPAKIEERTSDITWNGRSSLAITVGLSYEEAVNVFTDNANLSIVKKFDNDESVVRDCSEFCVAGAITDHRDGTVTVKMGKPTEVETLQSQLANAVTEEELEAAYVEGVNSL